MIAPMSMALSRGSAQAERFHPRPQLGVEPLGDTLVDQQARAGTADLALVKPNRVDDPFDGTVQVRVVEHQERRLAAELEREALAGAGGGLADQPADVRRAREGDLVDPGMAHQQLAGAPVPLDDVDDARRQAGIAADLRESGGGERRELRRLQHHRVAHGQGRRNLPGEHQEREVPRNDLPDDPHRNIPGQLLRHELRPTGMVVEVARHEGYVEIAGLADRLAVVHRLEHGEQAGVLLDVAGQGVQVTRPAVAAERPPPRLGGARRRHRGIDLDGTALGHARQRFAVGGAQGFEELGHRGAAEGAVDKRQDFAIAGFQPSHRGVRTLGSRAVFHGFEDLGDGGFHGLLRRADGGRRPSSGR